MAEQMVKRMLRSHCVPFDFGNHLLSFFFFIKVSLPFFSHFNSLVIKFSEKLNMKYGVKNRSTSSTNRYLWLRKAQHDSNCKLPSMGVFQLKASFLWRIYSERLLFFLYNFDLKICRFLFFLAYFSDTMKERERCFYVNDGNTWIPFMILLWTACKYKYHKIKVLLSICLLFLLLVCFFLQILISSKRSHVIQVSFVCLCTNCYLPCRYAR